MSTKRRARRTAGGAAVAASTAAPAQMATTPTSGAGVGRPAPPKYQWRQFPVYFALCLGMFIGLELGLIAGWLESSLLTTLFSAGVAVLLGFGVARLVVVWMIGRNWVKPRPRRRR